jgi:hypothetical protein
LHDIVFVEAALSTGDRTIVTGNLADYPPEIWRGVRVLTPAQAATELAQPQSLRATPIPDR